MTVVRFNPILNPMDKDLKRFSGFVNEFFGKDMAELAKPFNAIRPAVNVKETDGAYLLSLAAPGLNKSDFKIELDKDQLSISFTKDENKEETTEKMIRQEFGYSSFKRTFTLPNTVNQTAIQASYENGILSLNIPKKEVEAAKTITIL